MPLVELQGVASVDLSGVLSGGSPHEISTQSDINVKVQGAIKVTYNLSGSATISLKAFQPNSVSQRLRQVASSLSSDDLVELLTLDLTSVGGGIIRVTPGPSGSDIVRYGGHDYFPAPFESDGWEISGRGAFPEPKIRIANVKNLLSTAIDDFSGLIGAEVTRVKTFARFLDGEPDADPTAMFPPDIYYVNRKSVQNKLIVEFELSAANNHDGRKLPGRQVIRDTCTHRYRIWNPTTESFEYGKATCPYSESVYFSRSGDSESVGSLDQCGKQLSDCKLRYGNLPLPFRGFPGAGKFR